MQQLANRSYLKSQELKKTAADRQRIKLLERENDTLRKDKASLERKVGLLKEVIQKNRDGIENHKKILEEVQKELLELKTAA